MNAQLIELAERCEAAGGPDRELDARIVAALGGHDFDKATLAGTAIRDWDAPAYTASLDAAMTLVPEGWDWTVGVTPEDGYEHHNDMVVGWAQVTSRSDGKAVDVDSCHAAYLALCAAALRARASE